MATVAEIERDTRHAIIDVLLDNLADGKYPNLSEDLFSVILRDIQNVNANR